MAINANVLQNVLILFHFCYKSQHKYYTKGFEKQKMQFCNDFMSCFYQPGRSEISRLSEKTIK